jgi:hypothetical protein
MQENNPFQRGPGRNVNNDMLASFLQGNPRGSAMGNAMGSAMSNAMNNAMNNALNNPLSAAMPGAMSNAMNNAMSNPMSAAMNNALMNPMNPPSVNMPSHAYLSLMGSPTQQRHPHQLMQGIPPFASNPHSETEYLLALQRRIQLEEVARSESAQARALLLQQAVSQNSAPSQAETSNQLRCVKDAEAERRSLVLNDALKRSRSGSLIATLKQPVPKISRRDQQAFFPLPSLRPSNRPVSIDLASYRTTWRRLESAAKKRKDRHVFVHDLFTRAMHTRVHNPRLQRKVDGLPPSTDLVKPQITYQFRR